MARYSVVPQVLLAQACQISGRRSYAVEVIRHFKLPAPSFATEAWPWAVKLYTLGRFEVYCDDERLQFSGKAPRKPLTLLKALVAFGAEQVPEERLMDALWPHEEGDSARKSLDITVLRLRKLLRSNEAIVVSEQQISLNRRMCWTDLWALEKYFNQIIPGAYPLGAGELLGIYRGNFLPAETDQPWTAKTRERLRSKFVRAMETAGQEAERARRWEEAILMYSRGLEADNLIEPFYQGLMRSYGALGRHAEAMNAYRRLRQLLSVVLGVAPSVSSRTLAAQLRNDQLSG
jgi:DNA-binding SARP family transcriptional activator